MRQCSTCQAEVVAAEARFCPSCGAALPAVEPSGQAYTPGIPEARVVPETAPVSAAAESGTSTSLLAITSLASGILGWTMLPCIGAAAAVVTGHWARGDIDRNPQKKSGGSLAMVGLVLGYAQVALLCLALGLVGALFAAGGHLKEKLVGAFEQVYRPQEADPGNNEPELPDNDENEDVEDPQEQAY